MADSAHEDVSKAIAYVLSMKGGIPSFNYREIEAVERRGYRIFLYPTKTSKGLYSPKPTWMTLKPKASRTIICSVYWLVRKPFTFLKLIKQASTDHAVPELALAVQFAHHMKNNGIRIIHCHFADRKMFTTYFTSILSGIPYVVTLHSHELTLYTGRSLFEKALARCSKVITISDYNRMVLTETTGTPPEKTITIKLSAPIDDFQEDLRVKVLTVAKFHEYKGYDTLLDAARLMRDDSIVFWIVGEGPLNLAEMASDLIEIGKVKILGSVSEETLKILYQACDIFCLPSKTATNGQKEGLPVSLMEAMTFSKPVVTTRHAGIPELVERVLVEEGDSEGVAIALRKYAADPTLRKVDGRTNSRIIEEKHSHHNVEALIVTIETAMVSRPNRHQPPAS